MVDLQTQYLNIKPEVDEAIQEVLNSTIFVKGGKVKTFEENLSSYLDGANVITCGNGTDALQIALMALELEPGDEVITTPFTFIATLEVIELLKLKPVLVDADPDNFNIDVSKLEEKITSKTRCIIPVHLFGQCANMEAIMELANRYSLYVVEDACQALGSDFLFKDGTSQKAGSVGHIGCNSFFPSKNLGAFGDGGAIFTRDLTLANKVRAISNHGMQERYYHDFVGVNSRLDGIQAAILDVKLKYLNKYIKARQIAAEYYDEKLKGLDQICVPHRESYSTHGFHQYTLIIKNGDRDGLRKYLNDHDIPAMIYYPVPLHLQKAYSHLNYNEGDFPVAEKLATEVLSLPMHTELDEEQLNCICTTIKNYFNS
ncbi:DegT/DnrJ/EryC1/StrS family aminotransferase [Prolixibacteraceae bacterium JC049]|nr:DegT/DnrJ/EryC1/StrS family aminotransferase [Prolixibacteraceae bacterium JC049]